MSNEPTPDVNADGPPAAGPAGAAPDPTRRSFLGKSGKRALYLVPVILTLTARQAKAASITVS